MTSKNENTRPWREIAVDVVAMNVFSLVVAGGVEILSGMALSAVWRTRLNSAIINTITGRPYGIWRDRVISKLAGTSRGPRRYLADTTAFVMFQLPLYWLSATLAGAEARSIMIASVSLAAVSGLMGGPYGIFLDWARTTFGVAERQQQSSKENQNER